MRKEEILTWVVYGLMFLVALFVGLQIIAPAFVETGIVGPEQYAYAIITIAVGFIFNVILLEIAHVIGALIGGYAIQMGNILDLTSTIKDAAEDDGATTALLYGSRGIAAENPSWSVPRHR